LTSGDVAAVHESDRTSWRHRGYVRTRLNVVYQPAEARAIADPQGGHHSAR
jgi:hypothetical protein